MAMKLHSLTRALSILHMSISRHTDVEKHFLSRNKTLGGQVQAKGPDLRALRQAGEAVKMILPSKPSFLLPPSTTVGRKMHSSEESKFEQLSSNESFLPPQDCFMKVTICLFLLKMSKSAVENTKKRFQIKTNTLILY